MGSNHPSSLGLTQGSHSVPKDLYQTASVKREVPPFSRFTSKRKITQCQDKSARSSQTTVYVESQLPPGGRKEADVRPDSAPCSSAQVVTSCTHITTTKRSQITSPISINTNELIREAHELQEPPIPRTLAIKLLGKRSHPTHPTELLPGGHLLTIVLVLLVRG